MNCYHTHEFLKRFAAELPGNPTGSPSTVQLINSLTNLGEFGIYDLFPIFVINGKSVLLQVGSEIIPIEGRVFFIDTPGLPRTIWTRCPKELAEHAKAFEQ